MRHTLLLQPLINRLFEATLLLQNRGNQMEEDCRELLFRWQDQRGREFARQQFSTFMGLRDHALGSTRSTFETGRILAESMQHSEVLLDQAQARFGTMENLAWQCRHEGEHAQNGAAQARHRAQSAQASASTSLQISQGLGRPPI